jgi:hypothetical protein
VLLVKHVEPPVRALVLIRHARIVVVATRAVEGSAQGIKAAGSIKTVAQIDPGSHSEEGRQRAVVERLRDPGQEDRDEAEAVTVLRGPILGEAKLLIRPVTLAAGPDEEGEGCRCGR